MDGTSRQRSHQWYWKVWEPSIFSHNRICQQKTPQPKPGRVRKPTQTYFAANVPRSALTNLDSSPLVVVSRRIAAYKVA